MVGESRDARGTAKTKTKHSFRGTCPILEKKNGFRELYEYKIFLTVQSKGSPLLESCILSMFHEMSVPSFWRAAAVGEKKTDGDFFSQCRRPNKGVLKLSAGRPPGEG